MESVNLDRTPKNKKYYSTPLRNNMQSLRDEDFYTRIYVKTHMDFLVDYPNDHRMVAHMGVRQMSKV